MKKLMGINFLFLSLSLCALNAEKAVDAMVGDGCRDERLVAAIRFYKNDISEKISKNSELTKILKVEFQSALLLYKGACKSLKFYVHEKHYEEVKPSYDDYRNFMFFLIHQLFQLGYGINDLNNPRYVHNEILLYYWLRANLPDEECDKLYEELVPGFYRCLNDIRKMGYAIE